MTFRGAASLIVALAIALLGCGARETPRAFEIGAHRGEVVVPAGWKVDDQGRAWRLRSGDAELVLRDLGPVGPEGIRREVDRAEVLWRTGRVEEAQWRLANVRVPNSLFATTAAREKFWSAWSKISANAAKERPYAQMRPAFEELATHVAAIPSRTLPELAEDGLAMLDHGPRRDVKSRQSTTVGGREAYDVVTWNRLTHAYVQRMVFVLDGGYLFALYTPREADAESMRALESVRASLVFAGPVVDSARR